MFMSHDLDTFSFAFPANVRMEIDHSHFLSVCILPFIPDPSYLPSRSSLMATRMVEVVLP
jgi:hypothetical protein